MPYQTLRKQLQQSPFQIYCTSTSPAKPGHARVTPRASNKSQLSPRSDKTFNTRSIYCAGRTCLTRCSTAICILINVIQMSINPVQRGLRQAGRGAPSRNHKSPRVAQGFSLRPQVSKKSILSLTSARLRNPFMGRYLRLFFAKLKKINKIKSKTWNSERCPHEVTSTCAEIEI